jgi:hypothetical protein
MAKKKTKRTPKEGNTRYRRTDEELIQDLQNRIHEVKTRQKTRDMQRSPSIKAAATALKGIDRALAVAEKEEDNLVRHVLADTRRPLSVYLEKVGVKTPKVNLPRGRRPKGME